MRARDFLVGTQLPEAPGMTLPRHAGIFTRRETRNLESSAGCDAYSNTLVYRGELGASARLPVHPPEAT